MKKSLKIVHIVSYFQPEIGYQEYYLAKAQAELGHKVYVVTSNFIAPYNEVIKTYQKITNHLGRELKDIHTFYNGIEIIRLPKYFEYDDFILVKGLFNTLNNLRPDVVQAHEARQGMAIQAALWSKIYKCKYYLDQHDYGFWRNESGFLRRMEYAVIRKWLVNIAYNIATKIYLINNSCKDFILLYHNKYLKKSVQLGQGVDDHEFKNDEGLALQFKKEMNIDTNNIIISFVGKLSRYKNVDILISAAKYLTDAKYNFLVFIVGEGEHEYILELQDIINANNLNNIVKIEGAVKRDRLKIIYSASDICIWPSATSVAILEAMACENAIVLPDNDECKKYIEGNGLLFREGDINDLVSVLSQLITSRLLISACKAKSLQLIKTKYSYKSIASTTIKDYSCYENSY